MRAMMQVHTIPALADNTIPVLTHGRRAIVVDPGDAAPVLAFLEREGLEVAAVLLTHHHADHVGGLADVVARHPAPVYGPADEAIAGVDHPVQAGDRVLGDAFPPGFDVLAVPGHTLGHVAYFHPGDGASAPVLLSGDSLFAGGCGRVFEGTFEQMHRSLQQFLALPGETRVCCGHEYTVANLEFAARVLPDCQATRERLDAARETRRQGDSTIPSRLEDEFRTNPFLRTADPAIQRRAAERAGHRLEDESAVFATLRSWKDRGD